MKALVLIPFIDKETGIFHRGGEIVDMDTARIDEISAAGAFLERIGDPAPVETKRVKRTKKKG